MNGAKARWRVVYRTPWARCTADELRAHIEAATDILERLEPTDHSGYFIRIWQERLAELNAELSAPERRSGRRKGRRR